MPKVELPQKEAVNGTLSSFVSIIPDFSKIDFTIILKTVAPIVIELVKDYLLGKGFSISSILQNTINASGSAALAKKVFNVDFHLQHRGLQSFISHSGVVKLSDKIFEHVEDVLGLDNFPAFKTNLEFSPLDSSDTSNNVSNNVFEPHAVPYFKPQEFAKLYNFPPQYDGTGQTVALIELGGGYVASQINKYFTDMGLKTPRIVSVGVDGATNNPYGPDSSANSEVQLDIEIVGALAQGATIVVYFAPNSFQGFYNAILRAINDTTWNPKIISISWGAPEGLINPVTLNSYNNLLQYASTRNVSVFAASGDYGADDGVIGKSNVDFPSSCPYATGCGGTRLTAVNGVRTSEVVWNNQFSNRPDATGGGISKFFSVPFYQNKANVILNVDTNLKGRGVPDVSGNADPNTGYVISVNGQLGVIGGTSAVSPLWAALTARLNQSLGRPLGFLNPFLYNQPKSFFDVTLGNNAGPNEKGYKSGLGWDPCTGLGSPNGEELNKKIIEVFRR